MNTLVQTLFESYNALFHLESLLFVVLKFFPFVLLLELPLYIFVFLGMIKGRLRERAEKRLNWNTPRTYFPRVSCIVTSYSEGEAVIRTIRTLADQLYPSRIQLVVIVDGSNQNRDTYEAAKSTEKYVKSRANRDIIIVPKRQRGGRVSALNTGLHFSDGEIIMNLDGDTSFDNDMVWNATRHFSDPLVFGVAGNLRVRNAKNIVTRLQAAEYFLSINASRKGLAEFNAINNISGAFGIFRRSALEAVDGWDAGTAEDLDLTLRLKHYFRRHKLKLKFDPEAVGHTDVPDTLRGVLNQRLRWDGDLAFIYLRKHWKSFSPGLVGYVNFILLLLNGLLIQLVMPFMIVLYLIFIFFALPFHLALFLSTLTYMFYVMATLMIWLFAIPLASEREKHDLGMTPWIFVLPFYSLLLRLNGAFATLWELFGRGHEDTSMAPWWTTKKSKFGMEKKSERIRSLRI